MRSKSLILLSLILSANVFAGKVKKIEVKNLEKLPLEYVLSKLPVKEGSEYNENTLNQIYYSLMNTGTVKDVKLKPTPKGEDFEIEISLTESEAVENILEASKRTDLKVVGLDVIGNKYIDVSEILKNSNLKVGQYFTPIHVNELVQALFSSGYFREVVPVVERDANNKTVKVTINLVENPVINTVRLEGVTLFDKNELLKTAGLEPGKVFNFLTINPELSPITRVYAANGIITARIDGQADENGNVSIVLTEGKITSIKRVKRSALKDNARLSKEKAQLKTKEEIFDRMTSLKVGEILTEKALNSTMQEYYKTGLFSSIEPRIEGDPNDPNGREVILLIEERPTTSINGNVSYETSEGFTGGVTFADNNFLGKQQDLSFGISFGTRGNYEINASFFDPWIKGTDRLQIGASAYFKRTKTKKADLEKAGEITVKGDDGNDKKMYLPKEIKNIILDDSGSYIYGASLTLGKGFKHNIYATIKPSVYGIITKNAEEKKVSKVDYTLGSVTGTVTYDTRNDSYLPKKGFYVSGNVELGYIFREKSITPKSLSGRKSEIIKLIEADQDVFKKIKDSEENGKNGDKVELEKLRREATEKVNVLKENNPKTLTLSGLETLKTRFYAKASIDARAYHPVFKDKNSMAYRVFLGYANATTPDNMMFSTYGGGTSLRGYANETASIIAHATVENRTYIGNYLQLVVFGEVGINNKAKEQDGQIVYYGSKDGNKVGLPQFEGFKEMFNKEHLKADIGVGARLTTPLGVIRLDYAWPLINQGENGKKGKLSFGFGQTF